MSESLRDRLRREANEQPPYKEEHVPEWDTTVRVHVMTGKERDAWELACMDETAESNFNRENMTARLLVYTVRDMVGRRIFEDNDVDWLGNTNSVPQRRLFPIAMRLNGLTKDDVEAITKNSDGGQSGE